MTNKPYDGMTKADLIAEYDSAIDRLAKIKKERDLLKFANKELTRSPWQPIETAPRDRQILLAKGDNCYVGFWVQNFIDGDEAWAIADLGEEGRAIIKDPTNWAELPPHPMRPNA